MTQHDPNIEMIQLVSGALGSLRDRLVYVGGCATGLLVTEPGRPPARATIDVDLVVEVASVSEYYLGLCEELRRAGFKEDVGDVNCRWKYGSLVVDVMPTSEEILGYTNRWYPAAIQSATSRELPNGDVIKLVTAPLLIATKIDAFHGRGKGDYRSSSDIEDVIAVVDGRQELLDELVRSPNEVGEYLRDEVDALLADERFVDAVPGHLNPDRASQQRLPLVLSKLRRIAGL